MTYQEAKKIALRVNGKVDACDEYEKGFHFFKTRNESWAGDSGFVVIKESGEVINWIGFILDYHPERIAKVLDFATGKETGVLNYENEENGDEEE